MNDRVIGTCSLCGGRVCTPETWMSINQPVPTCQSCGATPKKSHGPVIDMERPRHRMEWLEGAVKIEWERPLNVRFADENDRGPLRAVTR